MEALNKNAMNQIPEGTNIFREGENVDCIGLILRGRVGINNRGAQVIAGAGTFFGVADVVAGRYQSTYYAMDNVIVYIFEAKTFDDLKKAVSANKDYGGLLVASQARFIKELDRIRGELLNCGEHLMEFMNNTYKEFVSFSVRSGYPVQEILKIKQLTPVESVINGKTDAVEYYCACSENTIDAYKAFYTNSIVSTYEARQQAEVILALLKDCAQYTSYVADALTCLFSNDETSLLRQIVGRIKDIHEDKNTKESISHLFDYCVEEINNAEAILNTSAGLEANVDHAFLERAYFQVMSGDFSEKQEEAAETEEVNLDENSVLREVKDSLNKILQFSGETDENARAFKDLLNEFTRLEDKSSADDNARRIRRRLSEAFYSIYEKVFLNAYEKNESNIVIDLFLNFGFIDERLLTNEQILDLYSIRFDVQNAAPCRIYSMKDWLTHIYEQKKEPSKSEFDLDYFDSLRERKRLEKLSDAKIAELSQDKKLKLEYEIRNMLKYNSRVASGRISVFVPFLYKEVFYTRVKKTFHAAKEINAAINRLLAVDYSIFYRERLYSDLEHGVKKEYVMEQIFPDIILLPIVGSKGVMWQEITGRKRNTPGRFLLPVLTEESLEGIMLELFGRFRWELCRTIQGTAWNNIQYPSLTSEYVDYIQFYQKNRDLTSEKKEKLKSQIARGRGNTREVFLIDYIAWVTREYRGEIRLNKVARALLATYVPFPMEIRDKVKAQPIFAEALSRFERERTRKVKELEMRIRALEKDRIEVPDVVMDTLKYYKDR